MDSNRQSRMEDYGSPETDDSLADVTNQKQSYGDRTDNDVTPRTNQGADAAAADRAGEGSNFATDQGRYSGGTEGTDTSTEGGQFGEFEDTGIGVDLTEEMENTDVHTGLVKGGKTGADDIAGPGQYGGMSGDPKNKRRS